MDETPRSRFLQRNQGAERVGHILELLSLSGQPLSLQHLSQQLGMHPSTAHRLLKTMEEQSLIARLDGTELYRLGPAILTLSTRMLNQYPVRDVAAPYLYRLASDLGFTAALSKYDNGYVTYLDCREGPDPINIVLRSGGTVPAHCTPSGRAQMAYLDEAELDHLAERGLQACRSGGPVEIRSLKRELQAIRQRGYATGGGWLPGVSAVAVAILDVTGRPLAAITVVAFTGQFTKEQEPTMAAAIMRATDEIAAKMGDIAADQRTGPRPVASLATRRQTRRAPA